MSGRRKGQFFIMGSLLLCALFFFGLPAREIFSTAQTSDISAFADNLESEIPRALNLVMLEDSNPTNLGDFISLVREKSQERYIEMKSLWFVTVPDTSSQGGIDVYAGNWLGEPVRVSVVTVDNAVVLDLDDQEVESRDFPSLGSEFNIQVSFGSQVWSGALQRDKTNIYCFLRLSRGDDVVIKEITG